MKNLNKYIYVIIVLTIVIVYKDWLSLHILKGGEWQYYFPESLKAKYYTGTWMSNETLGLFNNVIIYRFPIEMFLSIFGLFKLDSRYADLFVFYLPIIFGFPLAAYFSGRYFFKFNLAATIALIYVFSFNSYFLFINAAGHLHINVASATGIIAFFLYAHSIKKKSAVFVVFSTLLLFMSGIYDFRPTYLSILTMFFYTTYYLFFNLHLKQKYLKEKLIHIFKEIYNNYKYLGVEILIAILLFSYWLIPAISTNSINYNIATNREMFGGQFFDITQSFTLHHPYWNGSEPISFIKNIPPLYYWLIPILSLFGFYVNRKNKTVVFFTIVSLLGVFLAKQASLPFSSIYGWMYQSVPGFNAFRESSKFFFLIVLGYGVLIASFVDWLWKDKHKKTLNISVKYILTFLVIILFAWNTKPVFTREIKTMFIPRQINNDYFIFKNFILKQPEYFRSLWVPTVSSWSIFTNNHPKISEVGDLTELYADIEGGISEKLINLFNNPDLKTYLDISAIKYVIIPIRDTTNDDNPFYYYGDDRQRYIDKLDKVKYLKKINIGTRDLIIYENLDNKPVIYQTNKSETLAENVPYTNIEYNQVGPTEYKVKLTDISSSVFINFSDTFNKEWRLRVGEFNWFNALIDSKYFISDKNHFKNDAGFNSFLINPVEICKQYQCIKNKNDSVNIDITIFFKVQSHFYLGLIISGTTLVVCIGYLFINLIVNKKKNERN